ncbi:MAG: sulfatase [Planctomycetes bacterium]|nr:sulfatase [Planctomycetota bacterium]
MAGARAARYHLGMLRFRPDLLLLGLLLPALAVPACAKRDGGRTNVILVSIDTLRRDRLGTYGHAAGLSPNLDQLAGLSVVFEQAVTQAPWTLPAHAALFTSLSPSLLDLGHFAAPGRISDEALCLAEFLKGHGFRTLAVTAGGFVSPDFGFAQGFDEYQAGPFHTNEIVDRALKQLAALPRDQSFFLFLHTYDVHRYAPPPRFRAAWVSPPGGSVLGREKDVAHFLQSWGNRAKVAALSAADWRYAGELYDASVAFVDDQLGRLLQVLDERGLLKDSLVIVTSDHGEEFGEHGGSGHGYNLYDENLRVPLILFHRPLAPCRVAPQVRLLDVAPTIADLLGLEPPADWEGTSLAAIAGGAEERLAALAENSHTLALKSLRTAEYKYILSLRRPSEALFDLREDPGERNDVAAALPEVAARMRSAMKDLIRRNSANTKYRDAAREELSAERKAELEALGYVGGPGAESGEGADWLAVIERLEAAAPPAGR